MEATLAEAERERRALSEGLRAGDRSALSALGDLAARVHASLRRRLRAHAARSFATGLRVAFDDLVRTSAVEELDRSDLPDARRAAIIEDLSRLNDGLLRAYETFTRAAAPLLESARRAAPGRPIRVLELGSGHGDLAFHLEAWGRAQRVPLEITGSDVARVYVDLGARKARERGSAVRFEEIDALAIDRPSGSFDVVLLTQTLHHFDVGQAARLFAEAHRVGGRVLVLDGYRHPLLMGLVAAVLGVTYPLTLLHDGWISLRKVYAPDELLLLASLAVPDAPVIVRFCGPGYAEVVIGLRRDGEP